MNISRKYKSLVTVRCEFTQEEVLDILRDHIAQSLTIEHEPESSWSVEFDFPNMDGYGNIEYSEYPVTLIRTIIKDD